jgi:diguanylate cyclase (GGDEF)-like protein
MRQDGVCQGAVPGSNASSGAWRGISFYIRSVRYATMSPGTRPCRTRRGLTKAIMRLVDLPAGDTAYFTVRLVLSGLVAIAVAASLRYAWMARHEHARRRLAGIGCALLAAAGILSAYDAVDNALLRPHDPITLASWLWLFLFDLPLPIWALLLVAAWRERDRALAELSRLSVTDQLTGALNRRGFLDRAVPSIALARRSSLPSALIMFDIDRFKAINDEFGHPAGDDVLRSLVSVLSVGLRPGDLLGRLGGEEFAVFLHDATGATAVSIAQRLCDQVRAGVVHPAGAGRVATVSGGVAPVPGGFEPEAALSLALTSADEALYAAKRGGRDRIVVARAVESAAIPLVGARAAEGAG